MSIDLSQLVGFAGLPLIQALVEGTKATFPQVPARFYPALSVFWGVVLNLALAYLLGNAIPLAAFVGVLVGLAASGLYHYGQSQETPHPQ